MTTYTATYSPDDNKLRLYASARLDSELYARVRAAGFAWAPRQELFVAPMWTPAREDLLIELAGDVGDEDTSLVERAEVRAERFEDYSESRAADAQSARAAVARIADGIPLGQPILVGHHSERHARKDAAKIENGMRRAVKMWETSQYWIDRAAGALAHAEYKQEPAVRARRIKGIEADQRKVARTDTEYKLIRAAFLVDGLTHDRALRITNSCHISKCFTLEEFPREMPASQYEGSMGLWSALDGGVITAEQAREIAVRVADRVIASCARWDAHYANRIAYERAMLAEQGASALLDKKPRSAKALLPLVNYRAADGITAANPWHRGESINYPQMEMLAAEYARINKDYKGTRIVGNSHRIRTALMRGALVCVFLTDSKVHAVPGSVEPVARELPAPREIPARVVAQKDPEAEAFDLMRQSLRNGGVQVVIAPQLFATPADLAQRVIDAADIREEHRVLEPSAGTGALLRAIGPAPDKVAVEVNADLVDRLIKGAMGSGTHLFQRDFLECRREELGSFDRIVMNPPFSDGADVAHVTHAMQFLSPGGRLVAIMSAGVAFRADRKTTAFREMVERSGGVIEPLPDDSFKAVGTSVRTVMVTIDN